MLTQYISVFCTDFMTAVNISLYNINRFFITETEGIYCAVRTGFLTIIQFYLGVKG